MFIFYFNLLIFFSILSTKKLLIYNLINFNFENSRRIFIFLAPQKFATDLVHYFQNFGADENIDKFEDPFET